MRIVIMRRDWLDRPDGINIFIYSLADELATQGHEVICVAGLTADEEKVRRFFALENYPRLVSVTGLEKTAKYSEHATLWLHKGRHVVDALKPDCILINGVVPCRFSAHSIAISHDTQHRGHYGSLARRLYKAACYRMVNKIVATTEQVRSFLAREVWVPQAKISVIPTCFDLASYKRFPIESRERAILHMGTVSYKNPLGSVEILQKMKTPGALLYITGTTSGELTEKVSSLDPELQTRIKLVGEVSSDELKRLLGTVRVVSVPSIYVAPVASPSAIEGLASGTPVAASRSISTEVINDGLNSVFCDFQQAEQTAQVFDRLMTDNEWWQSLSEQGLMSATNFSSQSVAEKYVDLCSRR